MKLGKGEIKRLLEAQFSGNLVYMPIHVTDGMDARPVAQFTRDPRIPAFIVSTGPRSLLRGSSSALHLKGLLHHTAPPRRQQGPE